MALFSLRFVLLGLLPCVLGLGACKNPTGVAPSHLNGAASVKAGAVKETRVQCHVTIVGGSTAALASALAAAQTLLGTGQVVCLTEPTAWVGGQLTSSGVSAVDFPHQTPGDDAPRSRENLPLFFFSLMQSLSSQKENPLTSKGNSYAQCWVSVRCFLPLDAHKFMQKELEKYVSKGVLRIFMGAVPLMVKVTGAAITQVQILQRKRPWAWPEPDLIQKPLAQELWSWYGVPNEGFLYEKYNLGNHLNPTQGVFIDASEWGELLALSRAEHVLGVEESEQYPLKTNPACGQSITFPVALERQSVGGNTPPKASSVKDNLPPALKEWVRADAGNQPLSFFDNGNFTLEQIWTYRRISVEKNDGLFNSRKEISLQNWTTGNDYSDAMLFLSGAALEQQMSQWRGGVSLPVLQAAQGRAWAWADFLAQAFAKEQSQEPFKKLVLSQSLGTPWGLSMVPYIRDTRRSVGVGGFMLTYGGPSGLAAGFDFLSHSIGIGAYPADVHAQKHGRCAMPPHVQSRQLNPLPYTLPFLALTNRTRQNLLVAGKTMAQTFLANASTRVHPTEFFSGTAAGATAALALNFKGDIHGIVRSALPQFLAQLRGQLKDLQPVKWTRSAKPLQHPIQNQLNSP